MVEVELWKWSVWCIGTQFSKNSILSKLPELTSMLYPIELHWVPWKWDIFDHYTFNYFTNWQILPLQNYTHISPLFSRWPTSLPAHVSCESWLMSPLRRIHLQCSLPLGSRDSDWCIDAQLALSLKLLWSQLLTSCNHQQRASLPSPPSQAEIYGNPAYWVESAFFISSHMVDLLKFSYFWLWVKLVDLNLLEVFDYEKNPMLQLDSTGGFWFW